MILPFYNNHKRYGHWHYNGIDEPDTAFGFLYIITNLLTGRKYIGCKQIKVKRKKDDWRVYTGSNKQLNADIATHGKDNFFFEMISLYYNRTALRMGEARMILGADALNRMDYYNEYLQVRIRVRANKKVSYLPQLQQ